MVSILNEKINQYTTVIHNTEESEKTDMGNQIP